MKLILRNGYPFPYPSGLSEQQQEAIADAASGNRLELASVIHFEWLHELTIEFASEAAFCAAQAVTGWNAWPSDDYILVAKTSAEDGYGHPAIVAGDMAYCGFILMEDSE